jgi:aminopeptidase YwaD
MTNQKNTTRLKKTTRLWSDFEAICDCGGRLSGTTSEAKAVDLLKVLGSRVMGVAPIVEPVSYQGWQALTSNLIGPDDATYPVNPLVRSVATQEGGLDAEVIDLGRGSPDDFKVREAEIAGRIVMVRHELMFDPNTIHRREKYAAAVRAGATGFLIVGPVSGSLVSGSVGGGSENGIPSGGISPETAEQLNRGTKGMPLVKLCIKTTEAGRVANNLFFDLPGKGPGLVVLSAHIDGHGLAESAIDNATGLAVALDVARRLTSDVSSWKRGLRLAFFNVEEWALTGSAHHVAGLTDSEKADIALNVNLDSVAGGDQLTALTSGFSGIEPFLSYCAADAGIDLKLFRPLQMNSDHANFAAAGIPAFRLVAGFADPTAATSLVLTDKDVRGQVKADELVRAAQLTETIIQSALVIDAHEVAKWRQV